MLDLPSRFGVFPTGEQHMNLRIAITPFLFAAIVASSVAEAQDTPDSLRIDCRTLQRPTQRAVAKSLHIRNFAKAYAVRDRVMQIARRQCLRGTNTVEIVLAPSNAPQAAPQLAANRARAH